MVAADIFSVIGDKRLSDDVARKGLVRVTRDGLFAETIVHIQKSTGFTTHQIEAIAGSSYRTLQRHIEKGKRLSPVTSDRIVRSMKVLKDAINTFGSMENAKEWMSRPCLPLGNYRPIELLDTDAGTTEIEAVLGRIRHGVFS